MGNAISSGAKYCTSFVVGKAKYILQLEDNLEALESDVQLLEAKRVDLENKIKFDERKGLQRLQEVVVWLLRVEAIQLQVRDLLDAKTVEVERLSMCGYCSNDFILTYRYGKKVSESLEKVKGYLSSKTFDVVTWEGLPPDMEEGTSQSTTGTPSDTEEDLSQSTTRGPPSDIEEDPSLTGLPFGIEKDCSRSTTGLSPDIEEEPSQFTTSLPPCDRKEDTSQSNTALSPDIEEEPSQSTVNSDNMLEATWNCRMEDNVSESLEKVKGFLSSKTFEVVTWEGLAPDMEEGTPQSITGLPSDVEEGATQSTISLPSDTEEDFSQSIAGLPSQSTFSLPSHVEEDPSQSTTEPTFSIEKDLSVSKTVLCPDIEEDPPQSTICQPSIVEEDPSQSTTGLSLDMEEEPVGLENMLEATWKRLMEDKVGILGLYGMGGIGKTTLLKQIKKTLLEKKDEFDEVISVVVSQDLQIERIQKELGKKLGLWVSDKQWEQKTKHEKVSVIYEALTGKRFVILLDDIWRKVELKEIGIPLPCPENRSKVVYTTRSRKVCRCMGPDDMEVKCLGRMDAWKLFQLKARANTLASDPEILELTRIVIHKCQDLPLALNAIGETMACKMTLREWQCAIEVLNSNSDENTRKVEEDIFKILKLSYDNLDDKRVQQCFLYCALVLKEFHDGIEKDKLVKYWICEGLIDEGGKKEEAMNLGYAIIAILVDECLLVDLQIPERVTMHDVIRQMAQWIVSKYAEDKENFVVKTGAGLHEVRYWNTVRRISWEVNQIETISVIPDCPTLTTFIFRQSMLRIILGECFLSMPKLVVLDLSWNGRLERLPEEVSNLVSLRYLSLEGTSLKELPMGLRELIQLRHLDLDGVETLQSISVISSLLNLETLKVFCSTPLSLESIEDIKVLENLKFLSVTIVELSILECFMSIPRLASCTQDLAVQLGGFEAENISLAATAASLRRLCILGGSISYLMEDTKYGSRSLSTVTFQNLTFVGLKDVSGIQDLTWLMFAPSLTDLILEGLTEVREIISREKVSRMINVGSSIIPFQKLHKLDIKYLLELTSIYWEPLVFQVLETINVDRCRNLKKLPLNKESSKGNQLCFNSSDKEWRDRLEWEDEEIKDRLLSRYQVAPAAPSFCSIM